MKKLSCFLKLALFAGFVLCSCENFSQENDELRKDYPCVSGKVVFENSSDYSGAAVFLVKDDAEKSLVKEKNSSSDFVSEAMAFLEKGEARLLEADQGIERFSLTEGDGGFSFEGIESGFYRIFVYYDNSLEKVKEKKVLLTKNHELIVADFMFTKTCAVKGVLNFSDTDEGEFEKRGFSVMVEGFSGCSLTDENGNYYLSSVPVNLSVTLVVSKGDFSYPVEINLPDMDGVYETENEIALSETDGRKLYAEAGNKIYFNYRGIFDSAEEIENPLEGDFYYSDRDGSSYVFVNGEWTILARGGKNGLDGKDGVNGKDGFDGKDGADGQNGKNGKNGKDGKDAVCLFEVVSVSDNPESETGSVVKIQVFSQFDTEKVVLVKGKIDSAEELFDSENIIEISGNGDSYSALIFENGFYTAGVRDVMGNVVCKTVFAERTANAGESVISEGETAVSGGENSGSGGDVTGNGKVNDDGENVVSGEADQESGTDVSGSENGIPDEENAVSGEDNSGFGNENNGAESENSGAENTADYSEFSSGKVIVLGNGSFYAKDAGELTEEEKEKAVAVCFGFSEGGKPLGLGLTNSYAEKSAGKLAWAVQDSFGAVNKFEKLCCVPKENPESEGFEGELSGKNSLSEVRKLDPDGENLSVFLEKYPSFSYAFAYGEKSLVKEGWYLPSVRELYDIYLNLESVNAALSVLGGTVMAVTGTSSYYSSSQCESASKAYKLGMASGKITEGTKTVSRDTYACAVREFSFEN